ncbi:MAG: penicillin acylase family protein [Ktedonobacterales bacterium]
MAEISPTQAHAEATPGTKRRRGCLGCVGTLLIWALIALVALSSILGGGAIVLIQRTLPATSGTLTFPALNDTVTVIRDRWGVPYITASTQHDLFFAQGYVTAQDRLFQMEVNRRVAGGKLAAMFGRGPNDSVLHVDEFLRTLGLYQGAQAEYDGLDADTRAELQAYADGVNADLRERSDRLPLEFTILGITPAPWTAVDSLAYGRVVALSLSSTWSTKYARAMLLGQVSQTTVEALYPPYPRQNPTLLTARGDAAPLTPPTHLQGQVATRAVAPPVVALQALSPARRAAFAQLPGDALVRAAAAQDLLGGVAEALGSNNWVVDGTLSSTGKPLLANDPHLGISMPAIWYEVGLRGGGEDVEGFSFPGVPGVIVGHNTNIAWGVTNVEADTSDLYLEHLDPAGHPGEYLYQGGWLPLTVREESISVRGETRPVTITVRATQHGPLLNAVVADLHTFADVALKWTALQPGYTFSGFFQLDRASDWASFRAALAHISICQNFVYADRQGNIGYQMSGWVPIRSADNQLLPVTGEVADHEWQGYIPAEQLPSLFNPPTHIIATANNQIVPDAYPAYVSAYWDRGYRARRIIDLLQESPSLSIADFKRIQNDVLSVPATQLAPLFVAAGETAGGDAATGAHLLKNWDGQMTRESGAAAVYEVAAGMLARETIEPVLGPRLYEVYRSNTSASNLYLTLTTLLRTPIAPFFGASTDAQAATARTGALARALGDAVHQLRTTLGPDPTRWHWGTLHRAHFAHPLAGVTPLNVVFDIAPLDRPGDSTTIDVGGSGGFSADPPNYDQGSIPSMREIIDLSNFDHSLWVIPVGQSGQPYSSHWSDLLPLWDAGDYQSMVYSTEAIGHAARDVLILRRA